MTKISANMSRKSFSWHARVYDALAILFLTAAICKPRYFIDLLACSGITLIAAFVFRKRRANFMLEVFDEGDRLRLKLDDDESLVAFRAIEKFEIRDGKDGLDWIAVHLCADSRFGKLIEFYPDTSKPQMNRLDIWLAAMNDRIAFATA